MATKKKSPKKSKSVVRRYAYTRAVLTERLAEIRDMISDVDAHHTTPSGMNTVLAHLDDDLSVLIGKMTE